MADEQAAGTGAGRAEGSAPGRTPSVFVCDASAEGERVGDMLRSAGYLVSDVPVGNLSSRVSTQRPHVVLIDVDASDVLDQLISVRRLPGSASIDFVFLGTGDGVVKNLDDALARDGSAFFVRPIDVRALVRKIEALTGGPVLPGRPSSIPPSLPPRSLPPSDRPSAPSLPSPGLRSAPRTPGPPLPMSTTSLADLVDAPRSLAAFGTVSEELQQLLADAEQQAEVLSSSEMALPSPEEEIEAVLPADVLASLDEPIDGDDNDDSIADGRVNLGNERELPYARGTTAGGSRHPTTGARGGGTGSQTNERRASTDPPAKVITGSETSPRHEAKRSEQVREAPRADSRRREEVTRPRADEPRSDSIPPRPSSWHPPPSLATSPSFEPPGPQTDVRGPRVKPPISADAVVFLGPADARRFFAEAITRRLTGALCFENDGVVRRVVLREGDLVAAASGAEHESLVHFLAARGELSRDEAPRLAAKIPPYGRHAGAALVAHGWLRQDQLWVVLRAHAEWVASAVLGITRGSAQLELDPPGRLRNEPSVFGGATGAELFVDLVRRAVPADDALDHLGGDSTRIGEGPNVGLLAECNLSPQDLELVQRARGGSVGDVLARAGDGEILAVLHALALLGVIDLVTAPDFGRRDGRRTDPEVAALDEEAIRARVRARIELVEEGDYFSVLGVTRDATGYEVRRAFVELRRAFEPSRLLTPQLLDLADDVRKIVVVLEEAYEILRDGARRERYRRAIDARPE